MKKRKVRMEVVPLETVSKLIRAQRAKPVTSDSLADDAMGDGFEGRPSKRLNGRDAGALSSGRVARSNRKR
jgi:hypothetical protein